MSAAPALVLDGVTKRFGATVAVDDVSLTVGDHELLALVGPSGCGKSTLLRILAGLETADAGTVALGGVVVDDGRHPLPPERRHVGLVFQEHALFPHLDVAGNVGFGLRDGWSSAQRRARVAEVLDLVGLGVYGSRFPHELSGGERQRVALARALAPRPALLLLDEPFASLDPNLRQQIRTDVVHILRATGTPAVFVTHDQLEALAVGDRVAVLEAGRLAQLATPQDVFHRPVGPFVARFMGEADLLPVQLGPSGPTTVLGPVEADEGSAVVGAVGAVAMVRPDDVTFTVDADGDAEVVEREFQGAAWRYILRLDSGATVRSLQPHLVDVAPATRVRAALVPGHRPYLLPSGGLRTRQQAGTTRRR